ncbi:unnamed protein product [Phytophthora fragariaefolia]|uniref:Unnamed protein product n=1 Tax=Phytophthora fragariaefolia TaxID=1490495 RepID=A0A9W6XY05_9STRA|nr:unnamed protein product [Phytophthora fragariaefolia]
MKTWDILADNLKTIGDFSKDTITCKSAQARFNTLLASHHKFDEKSAGASGKRQSYMEKRQFLDELVVLFDEHERDEPKRSREQNDKAQAEESAGKLMRDAALQRMKDRKKGSDGDDHLSERPSMRHKNNVIDLMRDDIEAEGRKRERCGWRRRKSAKSSGNYDFNLAKWSRIALIK